MSVVTTVVVLLLYINIAAAHLPQPSFGIPAGPTPALSHTSCSGVVVVVVEWGGGERGDK